MGKVFRFNRDDECNNYECGCHINMESETFTYETVKEDPREIIGDYFSMALNAEDEEELIAILVMLFDEARKFGFKEAIEVDVQEKIMLLRDIQAMESDECDCGCDCEE
jgi:hypothetical protein